MSADDQVKVFDKFYRVDSDEVRAENGQGIGLALAADAIRLHDGEITVSSELNEGSRFVVTLRKNSRLIRNEI